MACSSCRAYVAPRDRAAVRLPARTRPLGRFHERCSRGPARGALRYVPSSASAPRPTSTTGATRPSSAPVGHVSSMARLRAVGSPPRCQARWRALSAHVARALVWTLGGCLSTPHYLTRSYRRVVPSGGSLQCSQLRQRTTASSRSRQLVLLALRPFSLKLLVCHGVLVETESGVAD